MDKETVLDSLHIVMAYLQGLEKDIQKGLAKPPKTRKEYLNYHKEYYQKNKEKLRRQNRERYRQKKLEKAQQQQASVTAH